MFELPPLFKLIQKESGTSWEEMYKVFNMGHRMELYVPEEIAQSIIDISTSFGVEAKIVGRVENFDSTQSENSKQLTIKSEFGEFVYNK